MRGVLIVMSNKQDRRRVRRIQPTAGRIGAALRVM